MNNILILKGNIVFTKNKDAFTVHENSYIISEDGLIIGIYKNIPSQFVGIDIIDYRNSLIIPSFVDLHTHAPQYLQMGNGLDLQLIDWLNQYTYPAEIRISDAGFAESIYHQFVNELYKNGSLRSVIFTTIHEKSTEILFSKIKNVGLSAYIGNVNMDRNAPRELIEDTEESITKTMRIIKKYGDNKLIKPIITPRFAPCCSDKLLKGLGDVVKETNVPVQTHLSENPSEIEWVKELFPDCPNYTSVYIKYGLYGINKTLMAHAVYLTEEEIKLAKNDKIFLVHCPDSNLNLSSGIMPVAMFLDSGIQIGLGTDIGASHTLSMANTIVKAVQSSKANNIYNRDSRILKLSEAFYLATKGGGNFFGNTGSFEAGYTLDALIINEDDQLLKNELTPLARLQRYLYSGDNSSIIARYLEGKKLQYNVSGKKELARELNPCLTPVIVRMCKMLNRNEKIMKSNFIPENLLNIGSPMSFKKNDIIIEAGEILEGTYLVLKGKVVSYSYSADGNEKIFNIIEPIFTLGDGHAIVQEPMAFFFKALEDLETLYIDRNDLIELLKKDYQVTHFIINSVTNKLNNLCYQTEETFFYDAEYRICNLFIQFAENYGINDGNRTIIDFSISHQFIGKLIGINRETTSRIIKRLKDKNLIGLINGKYIIYDILKLREILTKF